MSSEFFIASDGTIHSKPSSHSQQNQYHTGESRKILYWILSMIVAVGIGVLVLGLLKEPVVNGFVSSRNKYDRFYGAVLPYLIVIGSVVGSLLYGIFFASGNDYNLLAWLLSSLSAALGILAFCVGIPLLIALTIWAFPVLLIVFIVWFIDKVSA